MIVTQKVYTGDDTYLHGTRLDVLIEEEGGTENATVYDIEPEKKVKAGNVRNYTGE